MSTIRAGLPEKMVRSKEWAELLKARGWDNYYLAGEPFRAFLKEEESRLAEVLKSVGLVRQIARRNQTVGW